MADPSLVNKEDGAGLGRHHTSDGDSVSAGAGALSIDDDGNGGNGDGNGGNGNGNGGNGNGGNGNGGNCNGGNGTGTCANISTITGEDPRQGQRRKTDANTSTSTNMDDPSTVDNYSGTNTDGVASAYANLNDNRCHDAFVKNPVGAVGTGAGTMGSALLPLPRTTPLHLSQVPQLAVPTAANTAHGTRNVLRTQAAPVSVVGAGVIQPQETGANQNINVNNNINIRKRGLPIVNDTNRAYRIIPKRQPIPQALRMKKPLPSIEAILAKNRPKPTPLPPDLIEVSNKLNFEVRPRPTRDGTGTITINTKHGLKITSDMKYLMMLYAIDMGYSISERGNYQLNSKSNVANANIKGNGKGKNSGKPHNALQAKPQPPTSMTNVTRKNKKIIHEAACKIVCYDYGLLKPIGSTTLHKAFETFRKQKYSTTVNLFETRHQDRGRKSYIQKMEESNPGYLKSLFVYAKERSDEYTKYNDYRKIMIERSNRVNPDLDFKLTLNDLMQFFEKNPKLRPRGMPKRKRPISNSVATGASTTVGGNGGGISSGVGTSAGPGMNTGNSNGDLDRNRIENAVIGTSVHTHPGTRPSTGMGIPVGMRMNMTNGMHVGLNSGSTAVPGAGNLHMPVHGTPGRDMNPYSFHMVPTHTHTHQRSNSHPQNVNMNMNTAVNVNANMSHRNILNHPNVGAINDNISGNMNHNAVGVGANVSINLNDANGVGTNESNAGNSPGNAVAGNTNGNMHMASL